MVILVFIIGICIAIFGEEVAGCLGCLGTIFWILTNIPTILALIVSIIARIIGRELVMDELRESLDLAEDGSYLMVIKTVY